MKHEFVVSDCDLLKAVIVHAPGNEIKHVQAFAPFINLPGFPPDYIGEQATKEHQQLRSLLSDDGADVLELTDIINSAIDAARYKGEFDNFLTEHYPRLAIMDEKDRSKLNANDLIGASNKTFYPEHSGESPYRTYPFQWMYYTRDFAVMTPKGVILTSFENNTRKPETTLVKFMFAYAPELRQFPIIFDAETEQVNLQGGDIIVFDRNTLLIGIGNLSSRNAVKKLARMIDMDIIGINMPKGPSVIGSRDKFTKLNLLFLHLDTIFNITDKHKALVIPYFLQNEFENDNPFYRNVNSLKKDDFIPQTNKLELDYLKEVIDGFGNVTIFNAGSGNEEHTGLKLIDYLQQYKRFSFAYAGGAPKTTSIEQQQHLVEVVFPELYFQAANVIATKPGKVIIYEKDTLETQKSLRESGVSVSVFDAGELRRWHGGPHCMTFPISRSSI